MSKTIAFKNKYMGKQVDVEPGWGYPGECVSLVQRFIIEELGVKAKARGNGKDWRTALINEGIGYRVDRSDIRIGDIIAWDGRLGHVAITLGGDAILEQIGPRGKTKIGSIAHWDRVQPSKGVVTRLNKFADNEESPNFKVYSYTIPTNSLLYKADGTAHGLKTTRSHVVTILEEKNGLGRFEASWLKGVSEAWTKLQKQGGTSDQSKPVEKPKVKTVKLGGLTRLFVSSGGTATYPQVPKKTYDHYTNLKARTVNVVDEVPGRVRVRIPGFSPELIWINKSELK